MSGLEISIKSLDEARQAYLQHPRAVELASRDTVNTSSRYAYALSSRLIRDQVNLSQQYIGSAASGNRLKITRKATADRPEAVISARQRPVSLARFAQDKSLARGRGVRVSVRPGRSQRLASAFLIRLNRGKAITEDGYNLGLVVRMRPGTRPNKREFPGKPYSESDPNLYLLYGPSVDQVFSDVRNDAEPQIQRFMQIEFLRQYERYLRD